MSKKVASVFVVALTLLMLFSISLSQKSTKPIAKGYTREQIKRGAYLVNLGGCNDCHTPKIMTAMGPVPDTTRLLMGHVSSEKVPDIPQGVLSPTGWMAMTNGNMTAWAGPWGVSYAANLTPDNITGLGAWNEQVFMKALRSGKHMGAGRPILPPMPWENLAKLKDEELITIFAYLSSISSISNEVPLPTPPAK
jgi:hypothetical protein